MQHLSPVSAVNRTSTILASYYIRLHSLLLASSCGHADRIHVIPIRVPTPRKESKRSRASTCNPVELGRASVRASPPLPSPSPVLCPSGKGERERGRWEGGGVYKQNSNSVNGQRLNPAGDCTCVFAALSRATRATAVSQRSCCIPVTIAPTMHRTFFGIIYMTEGGPTDAGFIDRSMMVAICSSLNQSERSDDKLQQLTYFRQN